MLDELSQAKSFSTVNTHSFGERRKRLLPFNTA